MRLSGLPGSSKLSPIAVQQGPLTGLVALSLNVSFILGQLYSLHSFSIFFSINIIIVSEFLWPHTHSVIHQSPEGSRSRSLSSFLPERPQRAHSSLCGSVSAKGRMLEIQSPRLLLGACHIGTLSPPKSQAPRSKADVHKKSHFYTNSLGILVQQNAVLQAHRATLSLGNTGNISKAKYSDVSQGQPWSRLF